MKWTVHKKMSDRGQRQYLEHIRKATTFSSEDLCGYKLKIPLERALESALLGSGKRPADFRILDVGCGRGMAVAHLLQRGFDAYGGEASGEQVELARKGLAELGEAPDRIAQLDMQDGSYPLPSGSFDFIFSDNVIEHVEDLNAFVHEVARLAVCNGAGFHIFPSKWKPTEVHLGIPFVHWLPKTRVRYYLIRFAMVVGFDPDWVRNKGKKQHEAAEDYYRYIQSSTYYRSPWEIVKAFDDMGFAVDTHMTGETIMGKLMVSKDGSARWLILLASKLSGLFHTTILTMRYPC